MDKCKKKNLVDIMKCFLMNIVRIECHLMRVNVVKFHLAVASFAACDITSVIHSVQVLFIMKISTNISTDKNKMKPL